MKRTMRAAFVVLLFGLAACSPGGSAPGRAPAAATPVRGAGAAATSSVIASPSPTAEPPAVTLEEAAAVAREVLGADDAARAAGAESYALDLARDAQRLVTVTAFKSTRMSPPRYTWGAPKVIVPRLDRYPYWFAAVAERRDSAGDDRTAVLVFMKEYSTSLWQLGFSSLLYPGAEPPAVLLDGEGYATPLATRDESLAISPHLMAPLHATIAEEGPGGYAASLIAPGPQTTGYFTEVGKVQPEEKRRGLLYDSIFAATTFPIFALRAPDGGAVIMYSLTRTTSRQVKTDNALGLVPVPKDVRWATDSPVVRRRLRVEETQQYIGHISRRGAAEPAKVIGFDGTPTGVSSDMPAGD
ncbi:hypothetical protein [Sphaerisporangium siamense]|uniref:DUF8094 domain-containing protein n=1 Tax=Sphaerisporangium siamense TaxID=795645 RepID=A0A7W7GEW8_9ACTN|nr:hypothetical protein [Sphaerisporangium siamense]MBB4705819.1 hypothetical protein [Sphaerisporangium siamense]